MKTNNTKLKVYQRTFSNLGKAEVFVKECFGQVIEHEILPVRLKRGKTVYKAIVTADVEQATRDWVYNAFFRPERPSMLRLACIQLYLEGERFNPEDYAKTMLKIIDKTEEIVTKVRPSKKLREQFEAMSYETTQRKAVA